METLNKNQERVSVINSFMKELLEPNSSLTKREIYEKYEPMIKDIRAIDLFYLDMYKQDTTFDIEDIKQSAGKFVNVFHYPLDESKPKNYDSTLFQYFLAESSAIEAHLDTLKPYFKKDIILKNKSILISGFEKCIEIDRKFIKKENILFPKIEDKIPSTIPIQILWTLHDDARHTLKLIIDELRKDNLDINELIFLIGDYYYLIFGLNQKEELILLPVADQLLTIEEKDEMYNECLEYGFVYMENLLKAKKVKTKIVELNEGVFTSMTGLLSLKEVDLVFSHLPLDITFVDKDDKVKYFNDRKERHFPRSPSIIGRLVKHCHPPKSVHIVEEIVDAFKNNEKSIAEFWIEFNHVFLYITYYAVRDKDGNYEGTLEVSQDVTRIRSLEGQRRLLDWK